MTQLEAAVSERAGSAGGRRASIRIAAVEVRYGEHVALAHVDLDVYEGEFVCLLGPSGCGKTTLLNAIAGFVEPTSGRIEVNARPVEGPGPDRGVVFQEYALFPWWTVERNIQYGPRLRGIRGDALTAISDRYCRMVGLEGSAKRYPVQLSGGMRQRVAIARALANDPGILLMDEPFGALDAMTRQTLQEELLKIWEAERRTVVFVTHSIAEAVFLADRVVVMTAHPGRIKSVLANPAPHPRTRTSDEHFEMYRKIDLMFQEEALAQARSSPSAGRVRA
jgi:ABC-type nitrate/sulfonate/bicarbonate transport system ATPase subunit